MRKWPGKTGARPADTGSRRFDGNVCVMLPLPCHARSRLQVQNCPPLRTFVILSEAKDLPRLAEMLRSTPMSRTSL